jgi:3',5'-cyclic AMP phosphodiesterase CpdA
MRFCSDHETAGLDIDGPESGLAGTFGPYLQHVGSHSALVEWNRSLSEQGQITLRDGLESITSRKTLASTHQVVGLCGLKPGRSYAYRLDDGPIHTFRTLPDGSSRSLRFAVVGDLGTKGEAQSAVFARIVEYDPDFIVMTGDLAYPWGRYKDFQTHFLEPLAPVLASVPVFPAMGNHDAQADGGRAYLDLFSLPHNNPERSERYYSFDAGPVHIAVLDSSRPSLIRSPESSQLRWLDADLGSTRQRWKIVVFHHAPYASAYLHGSDKKIRKAIEPIIARHGVDLVLNGHSHTYQRSHPQEGDIVYIVTGGGGSNVRPVYKIWPFSNKVVGRRHHFVGLTLSGDTLTLTAIDRDGTEFDTWKKSKNPQ